MTNVTLNLNVISEKTHGEFPKMWTTIWEWIMGGQLTGSCAKVSDVKKMSAGRFSWTFK